MTDTPTTGQAEPPGWITKLADALYSEIVDDEFVFSRSWAVPYFSYVISRHAAHQDANVQALVEAARQVGMENPAVGWHLPTCPTYEDWVHFDEEPDRDGCSGDCRDLADALAPFEPTARREEEA